MARPTKNDLFKLSDGRETPVTLKKRGDIYRVQFKKPDGKLTEVTTGRTDERQAWAAVPDILNAAYNPVEKQEPRKAIWEQVLKELPTFEFKSGSIRPRTLEAYTSRLATLRQILETDGKPSNSPNDITPEVAKRFRHLYTTLPFTKSPKPGATEYKRSAQTIRTTLRILSCLWNHLLTAGLATTNPWEQVTRPQAPTKVVRSPSEADIDHFFGWLDAKNWELLSVFFRVKAFVGCRTDDLCQALSNQFDPQTGSLTIDSEHDKTHRERRIPLPPALANRLNAIKGTTYLWERYATESQTFRKGRRNQSTFKPSLMYWFVDDVCPQYRKQHPDAFPITPHDLRRRAITIAVVAAQGSVDAAAQALQIHPDTARQHYLDAKQAFDTDALFRLMAATAK